MTEGTLRVDSIGYVILFVKDMEGALAFYRDTVGVPVRFASPEWTELETKGLTLALHLTAPDKGRPGGSPEVVFNVDDVLAARTTLAARGVAIAPPKIVHEAGEGMAGVSCLFRDPDGHSLSIYGIVPAAAVAG